MMALESLLSESHTSNLTLAQNELPAFTHIFLIFFYDLAKRRTIRVIRVQKKLNVNSFQAAYIFSLVSQFLFPAQGKFPACPET